MSLWQSAGLPISFICGLLKRICRLSLTQAIITVQVSFEKKLKISETITIKYQPFVCDFLCCCRHFDVQNLFSKYSNGTLPVMSAPHWKQRLKIDTGAFIAVIWLFSFLNECLLQNTRYSWSNRFQVNRSVPAKTICGNQSSTLCNTKNIYHKLSLLFVQRWSLPKLQPLLPFTSSYIVVGGAEY